MLNCLAHFLEIWLTLGYTTNTMEETAAEAVVEAVVVGVVGTTVAVGHLPDLPGETTDTDQEAGGIRGLKSISESSKL